MVGSVIWAIDALVSKLTGHIDVTGWTMMFIFQLLSFGVVMMTLGLLGAYLWRTFDASRRRPPYLVEIADGRRMMANRRDAYDRAPQGASVGRALHRLALTVP